MNGAGEAAVGFFLHLESSCVITFEILIENMCSTEVSPVQNIDVKYASGLLKDWCITHMCSILKQ